MHPKCSHLSHTGCAPELPESCPSCVRGHDAVQTATHVNSAVDLGGPKPKVTEPGLFEGLVGGMYATYQRTKASIMLRNKSVESSANPWHLMQHGADWKTFCVNGITYEKLKEHGVNIPDLLEAGYGLPNLLVFPEIAGNQYSMINLRALGFKLRYAVDYPDLMPASLLEKYCGMSLECIKTDLGLRFHDQMGLMGPDGEWSLTDAIKVGIDTPDKLRELGLLSERQWRATEPTPLEIKTLGWSQADTALLVPDKRRRRRNHSVKAKGVSDRYNHRRSDEDVHQSPSSSITSSEDERDTSRTRYSYTSRRDFQSSSEEGSSDTESSSSEEAERAAPKRRARAKNPPRYRQSPVRSRAPDRPIEFSAGRTKETERQELDRFILSVGSAARKTH